MSRRDLDLYRRQLLEMLDLSPKEVRQIRTWGERRLLDALIDAQVIAEADIEFDDEESDTDSEPYDDFPDSGGDFYDDYGDDYYWYEYEVVIDYGND